MYQTILFVILYEDCNIHKDHDNTFSSTIRNRHQAITSTPFFDV